jgi:PAS domain S-box-containing protein
VSRPTVSGHILVVEDSTTQAQLLVHTLQDAGYEVLTAGNGADALANIQEDPPILVLTDVTMPVMDGFELCRALRAGPRFASLPVILMTGSSEEDRVIRGLEAGADSFVSKGFDERALLAKIRDLLEQPASERCGEEAPPIDLQTNGERHVIKAGRRRILSYLLSTWESALDINERLRRVQEELGRLNNDLEGKVRARTEALTREVMQRASAQAALEASGRLLEIVNRHAELPPMLEEYAATVKAFLGCSSVEIRLLASQGSESPSVDGTAASVPVRAGEHTVGFIQVAGAPENALRKETLGMLETTASQLATAIQRVLSREVLRRSEERYRCFFRDDLAGALILGPEGRILSCNPSFLRMFGYGTAAEADAVDFGQLRISPPEWPQLVALLRTGTTIESQETVYRRTDGRRVEVIENAFAEQDALGGIQEIRMYLVDITERKSLERQLLNTAKMEAIGRLAGGVAHDFNNMLQVIQGFTDHLLGKAVEGDPFHVPLRQIKAASDKARGLTQRLLAFSRRQDQNPQLIDAGTVVRGLAEMLRQLLGEDVRLELTTGEQPSPVVVDADHLEQALMNLAANARDAMPTGGTLTIELHDEELQTGDTPEAREPVQPGTYVVVVLRDTGCGMDPATLEHLFEPFYTTKEKGKGTGLGLASVYGVVRQAGGHILCRSHPGEGTEFRLLFPRADGVPR